MPISSVDFPLLTSDQAGSFWNGLERGGNFAKQLMLAPYIKPKMEQSLLADQLANKISQVKAQYAGPQAQQELLKSQLENKYYGRKTESEIAQAMAAAALNNQQSKWYGQNTQSEIDLRNAQAMAARFKAQNPMLGEPGVVGQIGAAIFLGQHPDINNQFNGAQNTPQPTQQRQPTAPAPVAQPAPAAQQVSNEPPSFGNLLANQLQSLFGAKPQAGAMPASQGMVSPAQQAPANTMQERNAPSSGAVNYADMIRNAIKAEVTNKSAKTDYLNKRAQGYEWSSLTAPEKADYLATTRSLGYEQKEAIQAFNEGRSIAELAQAKGFDPSNLPEKEFPLQGATLTRIQRSDMANAGLNAVENEVTEALAPYSARLANGVSPALIADMLKTNDPDKVGDALAAYAMQPEMASMRINSMGGTVGITAIQDMVHAAQNNIRTLGISPNTQVYKRMQKRIGQWINKMRKAEDEQMLKTKKELSAEDFSQKEEIDLYKLATEGE